MRPKYHFAPRENWLSDPNGLVHDGEKWHLFYQYNPHGEDWGHMSWGHATSPDLGCWTECEPTLLSNAERMVFSGSAVVDERNSAGFGSGAMVAIFTAALAGERQHQAQALAHSSDGLSWSEFEGNPVLDLGMADFRDPFVFRHEPTGSWIMVVVKSAEQVAQIYRSPDLKNWTLASQIEAGDAPGRVWECPTLVELPIIGTDRTKWFFKVDALHDAPGAGALYLTGDFDGYRFVPDDAGWRVLDKGRDFYAAIAWNGPRDDAGRPAWIGWMGNHAYQHEFPKRGWRGVMSVPRRLGLVEKEGAAVLSQTIEPSVAALFSDAMPLGTCKVAVPAACRLRIAHHISAPVEIADGRGSCFVIAPKGGKWQLARSDKALPFLDCEAEIMREPGIGLDVWIDSETVEILSADGARCASFQHRPATSQLEIATDDPAAVSVAPLA